jgi:DNA replication protein DnaC
MDDPKKDATALAELQRPDPVMDKWAAMPEADKEKIRAQWVQESDERTRREMDSAEQERRARVYTAACPPIYQDDVDMARVTGNHQNAQLIMGWRFNPLGMLVTGPTGNGKTRCTWSALKIAMLAGRTVMALDGIGFANEASKAAYSPDETERWMRRLTTPDILFIDDLAKRFTKTSGQLLFGLIERRTSRRLPILITTNVTADQLKSLIDDPELAAPLVRRLREFCNPIVL